MINISYTVMRLILKNNPYIILSAI